MGKGVCEILNGRVQSLVLEYLHKGKVHVDVVIQPLPFFVILLYQVIVPTQFHVIFYNAAVVTEFCGATVSTANHLSCPSALYLVH